MASCFEVKRAPAGAATTVKAASGADDVAGVQGEVEAVVATLGVVDHDRDIILPTAVTSRSPALLSAWGHGAMAGELPVGRGVVVVDEDRLVFRGAFFLDVARGREAYATVRNLGPLTEWSFGFVILQSRDPDAAERARGAERVLVRLGVVEVSPVALAAGRNTGTVATSARGGMTQEQEDEAARQFAHFEATMRRHAALTGAALLTNDAVQRELRALARGIWRR